MEIMESSCVPPGFRFRPTEEELVGYYLKRKIDSLKIDLDVIIDIDLYRIEPWDIQDRCNMGYDQEQKEWYFFSHNDRKYPTGTRTNRATAAGFWKATGRDKAVLNSKDMKITIGMRKTLVFYKGRAPNGTKTDWIIHEYRLQTSDQHQPPQEEGWVVCRAFKKPIPSQKQGFEAWKNSYYVRSENSRYRPPSFPSSFDLVNEDIRNLDDQPAFSSKSLNSSYILSENQMIDFPKLNSPSISTSFSINDNEFEQANEENIEDEKRNFSNQCSDWKIFDKMLASQVIEPSSYALANMPHNDVLECFPLLL